MVVFRRRSMATMNKILDNFIKKTAWMWLPFYALYVLTGKLVEHFDKDK